MRKSNLKILSLCVMAAGVFGLQSGADATSGDFCNNGIVNRANKHIDNVKEYLACRASNCKTAAGLSKCMYYCRNGRAQIKVIHPKCSAAADKANVWDEAYKLSKARKAL